MFLHLGSDTVVALKDVVSIGDYRSFRSSVNRDFMQAMRERDAIVDISGSVPKSFVVTEEKIYLSAISSLTLKKRAENVFDNEEDAVFTI